MPGDDDDHRARIPRDQPVEHREAFLAGGSPAREIEIEQDDVDRLAREQDPGRLRTCCGRHAHAVPLQQQSSGLGDVGIVVDDQDMRFG